MERLAVVAACGQQAAHTRTHMHDPPLDRSQHMAGCGEGGGGPSYTVVCVDVIGQVGEESETLVGCCRFVVVGGWVGGRLGSHTQHHVLY